MIIIIIIIIIIMYIYIYTHHYTHQQEQLPTSIHPEQGPELRSSPGTCLALTA